MFGFRLRPASTLSGSLFVTSQRTLPVTAFIIIQFACKFHILAVSCQLKQSQQLSMPKRLFSYLKSPKAPWYKRIII
jgi:hypothetical protein